MVMHYSVNGKKDRRANLVFHGLVCLLLINPLFAFGATVTIERQRLLYLAAEQALKSDNPAEFDRLVVQLKQYPLYPHLLYQKYQTYPGKIREMEDFLKTYSKTRYAWPVRRRMLQYLAEKSRWRDYLKHYQVSKNVSLQCHYYWALHETGNLKQAWQGARRLWLAGHSQPDACDPLFSAWRQSGGLTPDLVWQRFLMALEKNQVRLAAYLKKLLPEAYQSRAMRWLEVHKRPAQILCDPGAFVGIAQGRLFAHGVRRLARKDLEAAIDLWQQWRPKLDLEREEQASVSRFLGLRLAWANDPRAWQWLGEIPRLDQNQSTRFWRIRAALRAQNWHGVKQSILQLEPKDRQREIWRYWLACAEEATRGKNAAREIYQPLALKADFYGFMAADRLRMDYAITHRAIQPSTDRLAQLASSRSIKAIREFLALDRYWEARRQWWYLLSHLDSEGLLAAAQIAQHQGWHQMAIFALANAKHWDDLEVRFPLYYLEPVTKYAQYHQLAPAFVYGIIRRESAFDDRASSSVGARGLMQLMPATARKVARKLNQRLGSVSALENPDTNIRLGTAYFRSLLERFAGHFVLATAAYNAGPHRVARWLPENQSLPADIWIDTIPFRETRRYVRAVLAYAMIYQKRLNDAGRRISDYLEPVPVRQAPEKKGKNIIAKCSFPPAQIAKR